jgi:hypothetical protein
MTRPPLATVAALEERLGQPIEDPVQAQALLDYASALIRGYVHRSWVDDEGALEELPDGVPQVCVEMVFRAVTNPSGATQDTTGPFSVSFGPDAAQRVWLSKSDKQILRPGGQSAFTVDPTPTTAAGSTLCGAWVNGPCGSAPGECW